LLLFWSLRDLNVSSLLNDSFVATVTPSKICFVILDPNFYTLFFFNVANQRVSLRNNVDIFSH